MFAASTCTCAFVWGKIWRQLLCCVAIRQSAAGQYSSISMLQGTDPSFSCSSHLHTSLFSYLCEDFHRHNNYLAPNPNPILSATLPKCPHFASRMSIIQYVTRTHTRIHKKPPPLGMIISPLLFHVFQVRRNPSLLSFFMPCFRPCVMLQICLRVVLRGNVCTVQSVISIYLFSLLVIYCFFFFFTGASEKKEQLQPCILTNMTAVYALASKAFYSPGKTKLYIWGRLVVLRDLTVKRKRKKPACYFGSIHLSTHPGFKWIPWWNVFLWEAVPAGLTATIIKPTTVKDARHGFVTVAPADHNSQLSLRKHQQISCTWYNQNTLDIKYCQVGFN